MAALVPTQDDVAALLGANRLLAAFGSLEALFAASCEEIDRIVAGAGPIMLAVRDLTCEVAREGLHGSIVDSRDPALHRYLVAQMGGSPVERVRVVFADRKGYYLADEEIGVGDTLAVTIDFRALLRRAFALDAAVAVLAHNHPSGNPRPTENDVAVTRTIREFGLLARLEVTDHLIVAGKNVFSMRRAGLL